MKRFWSILTFVVFSGLLVNSYGSHGSSMPARSSKGYEGKPVVLSGWISGARCFLMGETCTPEHIWKEHEALGLGTADNKFYFLASVPRDTLVVGFGKKTIVKGTAYDRATVIQVSGMKVSFDGKWTLVYGKDFSDTPAEPGGMAKPAKAKGRIEGFKGYIGGVECLLHGMTCSPDDIWKHGEYAGLITSDNQFINLIGLPVNFLAANFTKSFYFHGLYFPTQNTLIVHHIASDEKGKPIWANEEVLKMAK